ncbi:hypothetical protein RRG08_052616 [Elysia crispata]|uniref:Uncharacterized protein n=1 Tax=Elysia crispata TaxID=231223 RepID=A0AAE1AGT6_9GAST|nr:hypothetical protein RRG08_052616 [Elysia crispata]
MSRAVLEGCVFRNTKDIFNWAKSNLETTTGSSTSIPQADLNQAFLADDTMTDDDPRSRKCITKGKGKASQNSERERVDGPRHS